VGPMVSGRGRCSVAVVMASGSKFAHHGSEVLLRPSSAVGRPHAGAVEAVDKLIELARALAEDAFDCSRQLPLPRRRLVRAGLGWAEIGIVIFAHALPRRFNCAAGRYRSSVVHISSTRRAPRARETQVIMLSFASRSAADKMLSR